MPLSQVSGVHVDQAFLGTCTNGRLEDLAAAAAVFCEADGSVRRVAPGTRLLVIPASSQVLQDAMAAGYIQTFLAAGAMIGTPGCGPCMGNHMGVPAASEVTISSANRNFNGRMGTPGSEVYLASPAVVAASAVLGRIGDPRELETRNWKLETGSSKLETGNWKLEAGHVANSGLPASRAHLPASSNQLPATSNQLPVSGRAWVYGDNVNTDVIFPGKYTYTISDPAEMARHALEDLDPGFVGAVQQGDIIVAGKNWGCGSSREQAATCLRAAGVQAIIAASFARIFFRNAVNNGLLPIACPEAAAVIQPGEVVTVDVGRCVVRCAAGEFSFPPLSDSLRRIVEAGGLVPMLKQTLADRPDRSQTCQVEGDVQMTTICLIPGDGVGQEVIPAAERVLVAIRPDLSFVQADAGWDCFERCGTALPEATVAAVAVADATMFGATQSPSTVVAGYRSPILALRKQFDLYANLRPTATLLPGQPAVDLLIVRENTEGLYSGRERREGDTAIAERVDHPRRQRAHRPRRVRASAQTLHAPRLHARRA